MATTAKALYGTTSKSGSVPSVRNAGPVYASGPIDPRDAGDMRDAGDAGDLRNTGDMRNTGDPGDAGDVRDAGDPGDPGNMRDPSDPDAACGGKLVLSESFNDYQVVPDMAWFEAGLTKMLDSEDFVERWRIWDCYGHDWADIDLTLYRFEMFDLVVRRWEGAICTWRGAIDTYGRVLSSLDREDCEQNCWQWLRVPTTR